MNILARVKPVPRDAGLRIYPATVPANEKMRRGKGKAHRLDGWLFDLVMDTQPTDRARQFIISPKSGWVNKLRDKKGEKILAENVLMAFNDVMVIDQYGKFSRILSININAWPPEFTREEVPYRYQKFTCINNKGQQFKPAGGVDAYYPILSDGPELWVETKFLDFDGVVEPPTPEVPPDEQPTVELLPVAAGSRYYQRAGATSKAGTFKRAEIVRVLEKLELKGVPWRRVEASFGECWVRLD